MSQIVLRTLFPTVCSEGDKTILPGFTATAIAIVRMVGAFFYDMLCWPLRFCRWMSDVPPEPPFPIRRMSPPPFTPPPMRPLRWSMPLFPAPKLSLDTLAEAWKLHCIGNVLPDQIASLMSDAVTACKASGGKTLDLSKIRMQETWQFIKCHLVQASSQLDTLIVDPSDASYSSIGELNLIDKAKGLYQKKVVQLPQRVNDVGVATLREAGETLFIHCTKPAGLEGILRGRQINVLDSPGGFRGAFAATPAPEWIYGPYALVFGKEMIAAQPEQPLNHQAHALSGKQSWIGFANPISIDHLRYIVFKRGDILSTHKTVQELEKDCETWAGRKIKILDASSRDLAGLWNFVPRFPAQWTAKTTYARTAA